MATPNVHTMDLGELRWMSKEQVAALSEADRKARVDRLLADMTLFGYEKLGRDFGLTKYAPTKWRGNYLRTGQVSQNAIIPPANDADCQQPGGPTVKVSPYWHAGDARRWGMQVGNLDENLFPRKGGRKKTGRPRKSEPAIVKAAA